MALRQRKDAAPPDADEVQEITMACLAGLLDVYEQQSRAYLPEAGRHLAPESAPRLDERIPFPARPNQANSR